MLKTGIFGGSFNPIHNEHIALAQQLRAEAGLDEVWLMVSPQNPLKQAGELIDDYRRLEMVRLAVEGIEGLVASDYEMHLPKPSYTWNTLQALSRDYPDREFVLLMGGDNWDIFDRWYRHEDIRRDYRIVVYPRTPLSSTEIRQRIHEGKSIRRMVPPAVADYIRKEGLYAKTE